MAEDVAYLSFWINLTKNSANVYSEEIIDNNPLSYDLDNTAAEQYKVIVYSANNSVLQTLNLTKSFIIYNDPGGIEIAESVQKRLVIDYFPEVKNFVIYDGRKLILDYDLSIYNQCNLDKICDPLKETKETCPEDCKPEEFAKAVVKKVIIEEPEKNVAKQKQVVKKVPKTKSNKNLFVVISIVLILILIIFILLLRKTRKQQVL
ncbi:hypothetical protein D6777_00010 [Candidatus Woesearchaeota archaeon]|nr:MAG: hypothetical protein D6777_00010 [Candidatus Woesearchaeota archaeon]